MPQQFLKHLEIDGLRLLVANYKKYKFIVIPTAIYIVLMIISVTKTDLHAWYVIPIFPFMALGTALVLDDIGKKLDWRSFFIFLLLGSFYSTYILEKSGDLSTLSFRLLFIIFLTPLIFAFAFNKNFLYSKIYNFYFYLFILGNIYIIVKHT